MNAGEGIDTRLTLLPLSNRNLVEYACLSVMAKQKEKNMKLKLTFNVQVSVLDGEDELKRTAEHLCERIQSFVKLGTPCIWDGKSEDSFEGNGAIVVTGSCGEWNRGEKIPRDLISRAVFNWCKALTAEVKRYLEDCNQDESEESVAARAVYHVSIRELMLDGGLEVLVSEEENGPMDYGLLVLPVAGADNRTREKDEPFTGVHHSDHTIKEQMEDIKKRIAARRAFLQELNKDDDCM